MINKSDSTWLTISQHANREIEKHRTILETPALDPIASEYARGSIAALRMVLGLANPATPDLTSPVDYMSV